MIIKKAYAKINLFLDVVDKRKDGYHNLQMINAKIDYFDEITIQKSQITSGILIKSNDMFLSSQDNIILQCARYMQDQYNISHGIQINIDKKIPYGAGLGGNSSDAAAVIHGINELVNLNLTMETMQEIGQMFGADIPYCLMDDVAYVTSTGEQIMKIPNQLKNKHILVIHPKKHILTADVFRNFELNPEKKQNIQPILNAIEKNDLKGIQSAMYNGLEDVVMRMDDEMSLFKDVLVNKIGASGLVMTGSGSTYIKLFERINDRIQTFINENSDKFLIKVAKII